MYNRLDLSDVALPQLPPLRLGRRRSSIREQRNTPPGDGVVSTERRAIRRQTAVSAKNGPLTSPPVSPTTRRVSPTEQLMTGQDFRSDLAAARQHPSQLQLPTPPAFGPPTGPASNTRRKSLAPGVDGMLQATPASPALQQFIVDKPPKVMRMSVGDHYHVPVCVTTMRVDMVVEPIEGSAATVELGASLFSNAGKRIAVVSSNAKATRDRSLQHITDESSALNSHSESVIVNLNNLPTETAHVFLTLTIVGGKFLSDVKHIGLRVSDVAFYPGMPELFSMEVTPIGRVATVVGFTISKERTMMRGSSVPLTAPSQIKTVPKELLVHLWTVKALTEHLPLTPLKMVQSEIEDVAKRMLSGWIPVPKGSYQSGGDSSRIIGDRMFRKAQKSAACATPSEGGVDVAATSNRSPSSDEETRRTRRDSVDTVTPIDAALEEFEQLFLMRSGRGSGHGRPRVVRKTACMYSVGRACALPVEKQHMDSDDDGDSDADMFGQVFEHFSSRRVIRYDNHCYNIGTANNVLLQYYLQNRDELDTAMDVSVAPRAPLVVDCVFDDAEEDRSNFVDPPMLVLDEKEGSSGKSLNLVPQLPDGVLSDRLLTDTIVDSVPEITFQHELHLSADALVDAGIEDDAAPNDSDTHLLAATSTVPSQAASPRFGPLKPAPPLDMLRLREWQEKRQQDEMERREREEARARALGGSAPSGHRRSIIGSAGLPPPSKSHASHTFRMGRGASAGLSRIPSTRTQQAPRRTPGSARPARRRQPNQMFSGQLLQWIDAYMKRGDVPPVRLSHVPTVESSAPPTTSTHHPPAGGVRSPFAQAKDPVLSSESPAAPTPTKPPSAPFRRRASNPMVIFQVPQSETGLGLGVAETDRKDGSVSGSINGLESTRDGEGHAG